MISFPLCRAFLLFLLVSIAPFTCHSILFPRLECFTKFARLGFAVNDFERYNLFFRNESIMELAEAGKYTGPDGIEEYVRFAVPEFSPYLVSPTSHVVRNPTLSYEGYENEQCVFRIIINEQLSANPDTTSSNSTYESVVMLKVFFDFKGNYISRINVFFSEATFRFVFGIIVSKAGQFICDTMTGPMCSDIIQTPVNCLDTFRSLPILGEKSRFDGYSQGCRALHAVLASRNDVHCPHLSFTPQLDVNGKVKCQVEGKTQPDDLFTPEDFKKFNEISEASGIDPDTGVKIVDPANNNPPPCGLWGLDIFCFTGFGAVQKLLGMYTVG